MRELNYAVEGKNANLRTFAMDELGHGGACHVYQIEWGNNDGHDVTGHDQRKAIISFQNGPIKEKGIGVNGVQMEDLIAICIDRLTGFQSGKYASEDNAEALHHLRHALSALQQRTRNRIARGVEGTHIV